MFQFAPNSNKSKNQNTDTSFKKGAVNHAEMMKGHMMASKLGAPTQMEVEDNPTLEKEADAIGKKAAEGKGASEVVGDNKFTSGRRRMSTKKVISGNREIYLGKYFYKNVTQEQADAYFRHSQTKNGWFAITQQQYELQNGKTVGHNNPREAPGNPKAWSYRVLGADIPKQYREMGDVQGMLFGQPLYLRGAKTGTLSVETSGVAPDGNPVSETFSLSHFDAEDNLVKTESKTIDGEGKVEFDYKIEGNGYVVIDKSQQGAESHKTGVFTKEVKGDRAIDTWDSYESEEPEFGVDYDEKGIIRR